MFRKSRRHHIVSVEPVKSVPVKCIEVDSPSKLFLAGQSMVPTHNTQVQNKVPLMEDLRNFVSNGLLKVRSLSAIEEMRAVARDGDTISAPGSMKDDRVFSLALAAYYWKNSIRQGLITGRRTREAEAAKKRLSITDQVFLFQQSMMSDFMQRKQQLRRQDMRVMARQGWRSGKRRY